ncbi:hypothetical protein ZWY2020_002771 [Hordeum vulgare]|nr:hypothetical protein ZWY2020_002771 [Hordeum vulgare]
MDTMQNAVAVVDDPWLNRHGFPQGYHFVPSDLELIRLLEDMIAGRALPHPLPTIFQNVRIREYHPSELHEKYKAHKEAGSIYIFSKREFPGNAKKRPKRFAKDGWWKASGGSEGLNRGGIPVGTKFTLVYYNKKPGDKVAVKTDWALKEYTKTVDKKEPAEEMALYRLYKMHKPRNGKQATQEDEDTPHPACANEEEEASPPPSPPPPAAGGTFLQAQAGQPHDYHDYHDYYTFGAAPGPSTSHSVTPDAGYMGAFGAAPGPSTSRSMTPDAGYMALTAFSPAAATYMPQYNTNGLGFWDALPAMVASPVQPSGPAGVAHGLPASAAHFGCQETAVDAENFCYQETTDPLKTQLLPASAEHLVYQETTDRPNTQLSPPPPEPAAQGGYLADEFDSWCEMQQGSQQVPVSHYSLIPDDIDSQQVAPSPSSPMPDDTDSKQVAASPFLVLSDVDFLMLDDDDVKAFLEDVPTMPTDENGEHFSCTLQELLYPEMDSGPPPLEDVDGQGSGSE